MAKANANARQEANRNSLILNIKFKYGNFKFSEAG